ncbi:ASCH domain-containing protein [Vagococcus carniphilus]|uniref:ASCH domain-containing protein n=1 Tax=Vagococcus carniphilus TaxID=218144 RepID=A0AAW8UBM7_9ENTE|nr:ASCH domain-containing protein [Vagococcus carniphilus]MDT2830222.1 ASCH domain-containing protein [Vagococcus carniphilus]MDT2835089.1 ASCH domain-containing protein [Vagococcus carniphilus]MDT2838654.1 ASCH domain-containing protein [Vagococcus carniphilus]MDT2853492.1 ASCH domain-containing protein [Vagococcus carniphilus]
MIETYWKDFCQKNNLDLPMPEAWMFGDGTKEMGDELSALVLEGKKTATCSAHSLYDVRNESIPKKGQYDIVLDGSNEPVAIIQNESLELIKMDDVTPEFAAKEGEGDLSYDYWYSVHKEFFTNEFASLNLTFSTDEILVCETFRVVYQ